MTPNDPSTLIDRRDYLRLTGGLAAGATAGLAGCSESVPGVDDGSGDGSGDGDADGSSATGLLSTAVSDDPGDIGDFESCIVTLDGIWVGPEAGSEGDDEEDGDVEDSSEDTDGGETNETEQNDDGGQAETAGNSSSGDPADGSQDDTDDGNTSDTDEDTDGEDDESEETADEEDEADGEDEDEADGEDEEGEEDGDSGGRTYYEFEEPQEADLTELQGEAQQLVGEHELEVGTYQFLQLDVAGVSGTLTDGGEADVTTPGNAPLKFNESFDVREGYRTTFLADFTPVRRGNGSYIFKPVAAETEVSYEEIEGDDGSDDDESSTESDDSTDEDTADEETADDGNTSDSDGGNETDA